MSVSANSTTITTSARHDLRAFSDEIGRIVADRRNWDTVANINSLIDRFVPYLDSWFEQQDEACYREFGIRAAGGDLTGLNRLRDESEELYDGFLSVATQLERLALEGEAVGYPIRRLPSLQAAIARVQARKAEFFRGWGQFEPNCQDRARNAMARGETRSLEEVFGGLPG